MREIVLISLFSILLVGSAFASIDSRYHTYEEVCAALDSLVEEFPGLCVKESLGVSEVDKRIIWGLKITSNAEEEVDKPSVLFTGSIHAEELIGTEIVLFAARSLLEDYGEDPAVTRYLDSLKVWIIPIVNPDGHKVVTDGLDEYFRKNKHDNNGNGIFDFTPGDGGDTDGVDINRNFPYNWEFGNPNWDATTYRGPRPGSESETKAIISLCRRERFVTSVFYHSSAYGTYNEWVIYPWRWSGPVYSPDYETIRDIAYEFAERLVAHDGGSYNPRHSTSRTGNANDWQYSEIGTIPFIVEVDTCLRPEGWRVNSVCENQLAGIKYLLERSLGPGLWIHTYNDSSGEPVHAIIRVLEIYDDELLSPRTTDSTFGAHYRLLAPGDYTVVVSARHFAVDTISVHIGDSPVKLDVGLRYVGIGEEQPFPQIASLESFPNPFNSQVKIVYSLPRSEATLKIFNLYGAKIYEQKLSFPSGECIFEPQGSSSGVYICTVEGNSFFLSKKLLYIK
ncbi:T9SS type A sorting domain-containing protein [bacterium]|nr:T9SS type A sorting domain-containing protein [bacterium]